jgi:CSLREA domain-containing protein
MKTATTRLICYVFTFATFVTLASSADAAFTVNTTMDTQDATAGNGICADSPGGNCSLRAAITEANALPGPDIIILPAGTYTETLVSAGDNSNIGGDFDILSDIQILGAGAATTIVQANVTAGVATERVFHIRNNVTMPIGLTVLIDGLTVQNGRYATNISGAGVSVDQGTNHNVTFSNMVFTNNRSASLGGGLSVSNLSVTPTVTVNNCTFSNNRSGSSVAGSGSGGAGIHIDTASTINIVNSTISGNTALTAVADSFGAGIGVTTSSGVTMSITLSNISNNTNTSTTGTFVGYGGGLFFRDGNLTMSDTIIDANTASGVGGGISYWGSVATIQMLNLTRVTVSNNTVSNVNLVGGAGIEQDVFGGGSTILNITSSNIFSNIGATVGGGLYNLIRTPGNSTVNITESTIRDNTAIGGGGIANQSSLAGTATVNLVRSSISGNTAPNSSGGGILNNGVLNALNSTVSTNTAGDGGGIYNNGTANLNFVTVVLNNSTSNAGGGLFQSSGTLNIKNTIVADNTVLLGLGPDIFGTITSQGYNHIGTSLGGVFLPIAGDVSFGGNPMLGLLAFNGGVTKNHLPMIFSPVVNTIPLGVNDCGTLVTTSQNLVTRVSESRCEKGADERPAPTAATSSIRGRLLTPTGRGLSNAVITLTDTNSGEVRRVRSKANVIHLKTVRLLWMKTLMIWF